MKVTGSGYGLRITFTRKEALRWAKANRPLQTALKRFTRMWRAAQAEKDRIILRMLRGKG